MNARQILIASMLLAIFAAWPLAGAAAQGGSPRIGRSTWQRWRSSPTTCRPASSMITKKRHTGKVQVVV